MQHILWTALTRIALMPTLILVLITAVLEASAIPMASKREVPDKLTWEVVGEANEIDGGLADKAGYAGNDESGWVRRRLGRKSGILTDCWLAKVARMGRTKRKELV